MSASPPHALLLSCTALTSQGNCAGRAGKILMLRRTCSSPDHACSWREGTGQRMSVLGLHMALLHEALP
eukprot:1030866-Pelagomonas_calceolata.AAC.5